MYTSESKAEPASFAAGDKLCYQLVGFGQESEKDGSLSGQIVRR